MSKSFTKSQELFAQAKEVIPGGVNSPVRAFSSIKDMGPLFMEKGEGALIYDADGNNYVDYVASWGPLILGHRHPEVVEALAKCLEKGTSFGTPTELETQLANEITQAVPSMDMVRLVNSGTEATMSALRLARGYTGRNKIVKFEGCYHGHADFLLIKAGSGALTTGVPTSPGVPETTAENTINAPFNDIEACRRIFEQEGPNIAAVIVEPVAGNMGVVPPAPGFLEGLRKITLQYGTVLIFDEVMTGFRVSYGGAQSLYGIDPDLTCLGKIIGGGLPVGAYGGKKSIMEYISPVGPVYQAGTLAGNPLAVTAGLATLRILKRKGIYQELEAKAAQLARGLEEAAREADFPATVNRVGSMVCSYFTRGPVHNFDTACSSNTEAFSDYYKAMLQQGIYLAPSQFESVFVSLAHTQKHIEKTIDAAKNTLKSLS